MQGDKDTGAKLGTENHIPDQPAQPVADNIGSQPESNHNSTTTQGNVKMTSMLNSLFASSSLVSQASNVPEVKLIVKALEDSIEDLKKQTATPEQKAALPSTIQHLTSDITPHLPGIALAMRDGEDAYVMPILFYKAGVTDATDTIMVNHGEAPRGYAKATSSFMNRELLAKVSDNFKFMDNKKVGSVTITSPFVMNLERYLKNGLDQDSMIREATFAILREWQTGLLNISAMLMTKANVAIPSPIKGGKLFGEQDAALARIEAAYNPVMGGIATPYNLVSNLVTANKSGYMNPNNNNAKSICKTFMNVQLNAMQPGQFNALRQRMQGRPVGPIVPVISIGLTQAGETLNHNQSILSAALGLFAALTANNLRFYSEAIRGKDVGARGNISVFNNYLTAITGGGFTSNDFLGAKNIQNVATVNAWIQRFVNAQAVYVVDVPLFGQDSSLADFWLSLVQHGNNSTYTRTLVAIFDALTGSEFSKKARENGEKGAARDASKQWTIGDKFLAVSNSIRPRGIAQGKDGKWFDLSEIDDMFLRQSEYYGVNEAAIAEYQAVIEGSIPGMDRRVREYNITNKLQALFQNNVIIEGWDTRLSWSPALFATLAEAMCKAGSLSVNSATHQTNWTMEFSNDLLEQFMTAAIAPQVSGGNSFGYSYSNM